jgi:hypothetical protein
MGAGQMRVINLGNDPRFSESGQGKKNKYGNKKIVHGGVEFDSQKEAERWSELWLLKKGKVITELERQVRFELIPAQYDKHGKLLERSISYVADFVYIDMKTGERIVEDTKGKKTKDYIIKRKLMLYFHRIRIREI